MQNTKNKCIRTALITGASGGIGAELAKLFAADGINVVLVARSREKLSALKTELESAYSIQATVLTADLAEPHSARMVYDECTAQGISVDALVCNAGFGDWGLFSERPLAKLSAMLQLNMVTLTELVHLFLPAMLSRGSGRVLNVASVASFMPGAKMAVYYASKAYVRSFSEALAVETRGRGVTVTVLCPGPVQTDFWNRAEASASSIFSHIMFASSRYIAKKGYRAMQKGRVRCVPGFMTQVCVCAAKFLPSAWVRRLVYWVQK